MQPHSHITMRACTRALILVTLSGCAGTAVTRESFIPIPEHAARSGARDDIRGSESAAARIPLDQQYEIMGEVVRRFYRPMMAQARWIDPRPLGHRRTLSADSLVAPDPDRAIAIVQAAGVRRVCPLNEANEQCRGLAGGVLRFSSAYGVGALRNRMADSALVYVSYTPVTAGPTSELEFFMARDTAPDSPWKMLSRRTMPAVMAGVGGGDTRDPQHAIQDLIAADRAFSTAAQQTNLVDAISAMFVGNVVLQAPGGHVRGKDAAITALNANADNARSRVQWTPAGGGVSSDGQNGFTYGYMTITRPDGAMLPAKYLAYWILGDAGWRVAAYKRVPSPGGAVPDAMLPFSMPLVGLPRGDSTTVARYAAELSAAERAFSRDAAPMGLGPAFEKWGAADAINAGGPADTTFVRGPQAIARTVSAGRPSGMEISWAPTEVIVSSTGDLGVSIGTIHVSVPASGNQPAQVRDVPFFTVWKRASPSDPWRYVAE